MIAFFRYFPKVAGNTWRDFFGNRAIPNCRSAVDSVMAPDYPSFLCYSNSAVVMRSIVAALSQLHSLRFASKPRNHGMFAPFPRLMKIRLWKISAFFQHHLQHIQFDFYLFNFHFQQKIGQRYFGM